MVIRQCLRQYGRRGLLNAQPSSRIARRAQSTTTLQNEQGQAIPPQTDDPIPTADEVLAHRHKMMKLQRQEFQSIGAKVAPHYQPYQIVNNPPRLEDVTLELLLASEAHLGHRTSLWNPSNARYIFGIRQGIHIIALDTIAAHLRRAAKVVEETARRGGVILFVGTRKGQERCVVKAAELAGGCHLFERWIPGSITNGQQILKYAEAKVVDEFDNEVTGHEDKLTDLPVLKPDLVVCLNPTENRVMLEECSAEPIPTIGIIDTNANPTWVTYPIPANDDSLRCVQVIAGVLGRSAEKGRLARLAAAARGDITFKPVDLGETGGGEEQEFEDFDKIDKKGSR